MGDSLNTFEKRYSLSEIVIEYLPKILSSDDVELIKFGSETITADNESLSEFIKTISSRTEYMLLSMEDDNDEKSVLIVFKIV